MATVRSPRSLADTLPEWESSDEIWGRLPRNASGEAILCDELIAVFGALLMEGNTRMNCTRIVGLQRVTLNAWIRRGRDDLAKGVNTLHARLLWTIDRGEGEQERRLARAATKAALNPVTEGALALKLLERRNPDDWAPAAPDAQPPESALAGMSKQQLAEEAKKVLTDAAKQLPVEVAVVVPSS